MHEYSYHPPLSSRSTVAALQRQRVYHIKMFCVIAGRAKKTIEMILPLLLASKDSPQRCIVYKTCTRDQPPCYNPWHYVAMLQVVECECCFDQILINDISDK